MTDPAELGRAALACHDAGKLEEARALYGRLLESQPREAWIHVNLGHVLYGLREFAKAERAYLRAIELDPALADAHWNLCSLQLLLGRFAPAWPRFHYRLAVSRWPRRPAQKPVWDGRALSGETVLLHKEFGFGDTIQFARYVPRVAARGARIVLEVQPELMRLCQSLDGVDELVKRGAELPPFDYECGLMELPRIFGTTLENIPADPYLAANPVLADAWRKRLGSGFNVGLVWSGNPNFPDAGYKCIPFDALAPLFAVPGVTWISLQTGAAADELANAPREARAKPVGDALSDFAQTAAAIQNLELVITVDTAVAHLAGALGKPVWLLLPLVPDWRWLLDRDDSPWYPTMRIFRQTERGAWPGVVERVVTELRRRVELAPSAGLLARLRSRMTRRSR